LQTIAEFKLTCREDNKQVYEVEVANVEAKMWKEGQQTNEFNGTVKRQSKGVLILQFRPVSTGVHFFNVWVKSAAGIRTIYDEKEPVRLEVIEGTGIVTENLYFSITGPALKGVQLGKESNFQIEVNGADILPRDVATERITIVIDSATGKMTGYCAKKTPGRFNADFTPNTGGQHTIRVLYAGKEVTNSPIFIDTGVDPGKSEIRTVPKHVNVNEQATFTIQVKSKEGHDIKRGGEKFDCSVAGPDNGVKGLVVRDENTGVYTVRFTLVSAGSYKFFVTLRDVALRGSPFVVVAA